MSEPSTHLDTYLLHAGLAKFDADTGAAPVAMPAMRSSTVRFQNLDALDQAQARLNQGERVPVYGRGGLDTHAALEEVLCTLEKGHKAYLVPSGMAAISLGVLGAVRQGDHVIVVDCAYAPVRVFDKGLASRLGIEISYVAPTLAAIQAAKQPNTRLVYLESPGSLLMQMMDVPAIAAWAREAGLRTAIDNTWGSGVAYQPLAMHVDISIVSATKYISGHSDVMLGAVVLGNTELIKDFNAVFYGLGYSVSADDVWLALRGVRTLSLRMQQSADNALSVAQYLEQQPEVVQVYHPALPSDSGHALWQRDALGSNGLVSFSLQASVEQARAFVDALALFGIGYSWGGFESLVQLVDPSLSGPHSYWTQRDIPLIRLYTGLEHNEDLLADLHQAFQSLRQA
ncbi:MAG TPA: cystathionine beta-lyase [Candidatus Paenalcaligenes intestinipullorum]|uniref:Cystathionine beta-lyase n=1 Tax=Candidatus Paenalcaligenes intestinipullorum TaxID=2838718 RepID=A0A9D2U9I6_9BURK|nr:cystathionine beta-lyase [Candidatus Paenalcaligenes intestinipullorum]